MQENLKNKKGITLIALVVTIIVLIILAGVSISLVLGDNGIVTKAKEAKQNMQVAANEEQASLANVEVVIENEGGVGGESPTPQISINDLKAGEYIKYDTGVDGVGEITCRVLYEASSEYGLQIISNKNVGSGITLGGATFNTIEARTSYNSTIETLNREAGKYLNTTYAVDARCVGSLPSINLDGSFKEKNKGTETTVILPPDTWSSYTRPNLWTSDDTECYDKDTNYVTDETQMINANIKTTGQYYWLASRDVSSDSSSCYFYLRRVDSYGGLSKYSFLYVDSSEMHPSGSSTNNGLRPCFSLRSDIKITGGDGQSEVTAYTMRYLEETMQLVRKICTLIEV